MNLGLSLGLNRISGGGAGFSHADDAGLVEYWDTTQGVTSSSNAVSQWRGRVASTDLAQGTGSEQPSTGTRSIGGRNVIDGDGGDYLSGAITLPSSGNVTFMFVGVVDAVTGNTEGLLAYNSATNDFQFNSGTTSEYWCRLQGSGGIPTMPADNGSYMGPSIYEIVLNFDSGSAEVLVDGVQVQFSASGYTAKIDTSGDLLILTKRGPSIFLDGAIGDLLVTESVDASTRLNHRTLLASNFGISL